jgi:hypothetical protein
VSAPRSAADLLAALLAVTPEPPAELDPETVLDTTTEILAACAPLVAELREILGEAKVPAELVPEASALHARTKKWLELADAARNETGESLRAAVTAKRYQAHR